MMKFLKALADKRTPQWEDVLLWVPQPVLRYVDRYFRHERHGDRPGSVSGYVLAFQSRLRQSMWRDAYRQHGIQAAIALAV